MVYMYICVDRPYENVLSLQTSLFSVIVEIMDSKGLKFCYFFLWLSPTKTHGESKSTRVYFAFLHNY